VTVGILVGAAVGLGVLGVVRGLTAAPPSLEALAAVLERPVGIRPRAQSAGHGVERVGMAVVSRFDRSPQSEHPRWSAGRSCLAVTGESAEQLATKVVMAGAAGLLGPAVVWVLSRSVGSTLPLGLAVAAGLLAAPLCAGAPLMGLVARAKERRRHFRGVVGTFVDLVVLSLAGGVGIEGALLAASQISSDWAAQRMGRVLLRARDSGESPWSALGRLGQEVGVPELEELSSSLQLAGTEGTKIRQSLSARAVSLRRHEQADAESAANATTERLFLPGALLLVGFLLFVGYPAFSRILGGW
jgi:Flp pilus assembly protein TadB